MYVRYFVSVTSVNIGRRNCLWTRSTTDRPMSTGFHSIWYPLQAVYKRIFSSAGSRIRIDVYFCESSRSARLHLLLPSTFLSLSHVSCRTRVRELETARSIGDAGVNNRTSRSHSASLVAKVLVRLSKRYFTYVHYTRIHGVCRRFFVRRDTRWEFRPQNPER